MIPLLHPNFYMKTHYPRFLLLKKWFNRCLFYRHHSLAIPLPLVTVFLSLGALIFVQTLSAQNSLPCDCTQRWTDGAHWEKDGTIDDNPNAPDELGIIRCGSSAETQPQINAINNCVYNPDPSTGFPVDLSGQTCIDPSSGLPVTISGPTSGQPVIWLNFDVRADAGAFQIQLNDNDSQDDLAWALYYSTTRTTSVSENTIVNDSLSGDCSQLVGPVACGQESSSSWNTIPVPNFDEVTNYYLIAWDEKADGNVDINNFKARFGCGDVDDACFLGVEEEKVSITCTGLDQGEYKVTIPLLGFNGDFTITKNGGDVEVSDISIVDENGNPSDLSFSNNGVANPDITAILCFNVPFGGSYDFTLSGTPNSNCSNQCQPCPPIDLAGSLPGFSCSLPGDELICFEETATLTPSTSSTGSATPAVYNWFKNGSAFTSINGGTGALTTGMAGSYTLEVEWTGTDPDLKLNYDGCVTTCTGDAAEVTVQGPIYDYGYPNEPGVDDPYDGHPMVDNIHSHTVWIDFPKYLNATSYGDASLQTALSGLDRYFSEVSINDAIRTDPSASPTETTSPLELTFNPDGTASITGELAYVDDPCVRLEVNIVTTVGETWDEWKVNASRTPVANEDLAGTDVSKLPIKVDYIDPPDPATKYWEQWMYYLIDESQSTMTLTCEAGCANAACAVTDLDFKVKNITNFNYALQFGTGANDKDADPFGLSGWYQMCSLDGQGNEDGKASIRADINAVGICETTSSPSAVVGIESFNAQRQGNDVLLSLTMAPGASYDQIIIERSTNGYAFHSIGGFDRNGNVTRSNTLEFLDPDHQYDQLKYRVFVDVSHPLVGFGYSATVDPDASLPVEWLSFTATPISPNEVQLEWITASELNNDRFIIEKKRGEGSFLPIGQVAGAQTSLEPQSYSFTDGSLMGQQNAYRLKQIDIDGNFSYSPVVEISFEALSPAYHIYPNPIENLLVVEFLEQLEGNYEVQLSDLRGRSILNHRHVSGSEIRLDVSSLASGTYILSIRNSQGQVFIQKINK